MNWDEIRDGHISPRTVSVLNADDAGRAEFLAGAEVLGLCGRFQRPGHELHSQQLFMADALQARRPDGRIAHPTMGVLIPRRSSKTTSIVATALGRALLREEHYVAFTFATTGSSARKRYRQDIIAPLERSYPDPDNRPFRIRRSIGSESIEFLNTGSRVDILTPSGEAFRSEAYDTIIIDESGEATPEMGDDLLTGALATMDTRPDGQLIIAGTAPKYREGNLLYDTIMDGRNQRRRTGIIEYGLGIDQFLSLDDLESWDIVRELVLESHPGVGTLTDLETIEDRHARLTPLKFAAEYLSVAGYGGAGSGMFDVAAWSTLAVGGELPAPPKNFALAVSVHSDQESAAIAAVWRVRKRAHAVILDHRPGTRWLPEEAARLAKKYRVPIVHDSRGPVLVEAETMQRMKNRPKLLPQTTKDVTTAAQALTSEIEAGNITHYDQDILNAAVKVVRKRRILGSWGFGRGNDTDDITPIEAVSLALRVYDAKPTRSDTGVVTS